MLTIQAQTAQILIYLRFDPFSLCYCLPSRSALAIVLATMWRIKRFKQRILLAMMLVSLGTTGFAPVLADTTAVPSLTISQLKITSSNGQFVTLYNSTNSTLNMSNYQLEYFNSFDLSKATSSKLVALTGTLPPHSYFMVNDGTLQLCYQLTVDSVSLGFSSTAGLVELLALNQTTPGGLVASSLQDYVGWSKTAASGAQTLPTNTAAFLQRQPVDAKNNPLVTAPGSGSWQAVQPDPATACGLVSTTSTPTPVVTGLSQLLPTSEPPATIVSASASDDVAPQPSLPASDIGLMAPQITELLPNPVGTGNDSTDEYVELYNGNDVAFDLSGFTLQTGLTTLHSYVFPAGSSLAPQSFTAFYAEQTKLTLSNSGSQATLLDPLGNSVATTDAYGTAVDGQSWALANGSWYWTTQVTPGTANIINQPQVKAAKVSSKVAKSKNSGTVKAASTTKKLKTVTPTAKTAVAAAPAAVPIHPWMLALVGSLALLYGIYEYRKDLANYVRKLGSKLGFGRKDRPESARRRGD